MKHRSTMLISLVLIFIFVSGLSLAQQPPPNGTPPPRPGDAGGNAPAGGGGPNRQALTIDSSYQAVPNTYTGIGSVTMGSAESFGDLSLTTECPNGDGFVAAESGMITAEDGTEWTVPMVVNEGIGATNLFNNCAGTGDNANYMNELETVVVDADGQEISAFIFADNYFELYINDEFIARDPIGFTPFNSNAVSFQVNYPYTIAVHLADWETHLGIGMEYVDYHIGDAGFIALFSDGTETNEEWQCQALYIAPLDDPVCVVEDENGNPDSSGCQSKPTCSTSNPELCRALHYPLAENWVMSDFDDSTWLNATLYDASLVTNQRAYVDYASMFGTADFIWTQNLDLDNEVVCRKTVTAPSN